jgi:hypothetical protein
VVVEDRFARSGDAVLHGLGGKRAGYEAEVARAELEEMVGSDVAGGEVVDADKIEIAAGGEWANVTVEKHDGDSSLSQALGEAAVYVVGMGDVLEGGEEYAADLALDELLAPLLDLRDGCGLGALRSDVAAPEEAVVMAAGEAGEFTGNCLEYFGRSQAGDHQAKLTSADIGGA